MECTSSFLAAILRLLENNRLTAVVGVWAAHRLGGCHFIDL
jgi:hypothetical protein